MKHLGLRVAARVTIVWTSGPLACPAIGLSRRVEATFLRPPATHISHFFTLPRPAYLTRIAESFRVPVLGDMRQPLGSTRTMLLAAT